MIKRAAGVILGVAVVLSLSACSVQNRQAAVSLEEPEGVSQPSPGPDWPAPPAEPEAESSRAPAARPPSASCANEAADRILRELIQPGMSDYLKVQTVYEYLVENTYFDEDRPIGLEIWRVRVRHDDPDYRPGFVENRALSVLLYGLGSCEDYAAALTFLLERMGFEARYVPGLTLSVYGGFVDHAWTAVQLDGVWYHLDAQLEQNVMRNNLLTYRYFLCPDASMSIDHRWGQNLIDYGVLTPGQEAEIARDYLLEECPSGNPPPLPKVLSPPPRPDRAAIQASIDAEIAAYEALHGPLPPLELDVLPPVFGSEGYEE